MNKIYTNCSDEAIHIPGFIQPHGSVLIVTKQSLLVAAVSTNSTRLFMAPETVLKKNLAEAIAPLCAVASHSSLLDSILSGHFKEVEEGIHHTDRMYIQGTGYYLTAHNYGMNTYLEWEPIQDPHFNVADYANAAKIISRAATTQDAWKHLVQEVRRIIAYDRVMVYKFQHDGSGIVIEESKPDALPSHLHLHYPKDDIPAQARALYLKKTFRILANADAVPNALQSYNAQSIDLTYCHIRSLSPIHMQYVKNSGSTSSFSVSIIINEKLWGLVTCQNSTAQNIDLLKQQYVEMLTIMAVGAYQTSLLNEKKKLDEKFTALHLLMKGDILTNNSLKNTLVTYKKEIAAIIEADGLAMMLEDDIIAEGIVPDTHTLQTICHWAQQHIEEDIFYSNKFLKEYKHLLPLNSSTAGIMVSKLGKNNIIIWFRKEQSQIINWAGKPEKIYKQTKGNTYTASPRESFEVWAEEVKETAFAWSNEEKEAVDKITSLITKTTYAKSQKIAALNEQLLKVNEELDAFSYTVSHDLKTPLMVMKLNAQFLKKQIAEHATANRNLDTIIQQIDDMDLLMKNILLLSKIKKHDIDLETIAPGQMITDLCNQLKIVHAAPDTVIHIGHLPEISGDSTFVYQIFLNLISNAIKYSSKEEAPVITINGKETNGNIQYTLTDNGIGIDHKEKQKMFQAFSRLNNAKNFDGHGIGLSIVYRIISRMGGSIHFESELGKGTSFFAIFQKPLP